MQQQQTLLQRLSPQQRAAFQQLSPEQKRAQLQRLALQQQQAWYPVFKLEIDSVAPDPLETDKRYHQAIFVKTDSNSGSGRLFHVTGDIISASGMRYEEKGGYTPGHSKQSPLS
ncbi:hypothetical protein B0A50_03015 [Salinomyces thailandicus]|uniref:Uncharacterized protein n=1 Tax=Salinomyces thailandicus TaxID=706561 RepID=A0A4U0U1H1_9PEZI|nr:hypothetical protein B0A50_03015 [Salinomyces thailandica]